MNKAFLLIFTIILTMCLAYYSLFIIKNNLLLKKNYSYQSYYYQGELYLQFFTKYLNSLDLSTKKIKTVLIERNNFILSANIIYIKNEAILNLEVRHNKKELRLYKTYKKIL